MNIPKIDCHTHIVNQTIYGQYLSTPAADNYALVMEFLPYMTTEQLPDHSWELCDGNEKLFLCPSIMVQNLSAAICAFCQYTQCKECNGNSKQYCSQSSECVFISLLKHNTHS